MRNYTNTERTATIHNLYNGDKFTLEFPIADCDEMEKALERATSNFEHDYEVVDFEGFCRFVPVYHVHCVTIGELNSIAERLERLEDEDADKLEAMVEYCDNLDDIESAWDDSFFIHNATLADYAEELAYECGYIPSELPAWISCHIDWEGVGRELSYDGYSEINGGVLYVAQ